MLNPNVVSIFNGEVRFLEAEKGGILWGFFLSKLLVFTFDWGVATVNMQSF